MLVDTLRPRRLVWNLLGRARAGWALRLRGLPVLGTLVHAVSHSLWPAGRREWIRVESGIAAGLELYLDPRYDARLWHGDAERDLQEQLAELVRPGAVVWDVGAHVGFYSLAFARLAGPDGYVVSFEPNERNVEILHATLRRNGVGTVDVRPLAVWSQAGAVPFGAVPGTGRHGSVGAAGSVTTVNATTLDLESADGPPPDVVKIDVEGAEEHVLLGASELLARVRPLVVCEVHLERGGRPELRQRVRDLLEAAGYRVEEVDPGASPLHVVAEPVDSPRASAS